MKHRGLTRRDWMAFAARVALASSLPGMTTSALALPPRTLVFPRDHGSHPELQTEWWYITGHVRSKGKPFGFQVTFFRSRVASTQGMQSAFAAKQLIFAHAAVTDIEGRVQHHDQRIARAGFGIAEASETDCDVRLRDWNLKREGPVDQYRFATRIRSTRFEMDLTLQGTQPLLLQGRAGLSRKGPDADQASYYYSAPQLAVRGILTLNGVHHVIDDVVDDVVQPQVNRAWMDHEWSEALMHPEAVGWDWIGMNLFDGSALTAFRLRRADGSTLWAGGSMRAPGGATQPRVFAQDEVTFTPTRHWSSPHSQARYPVQWRIDTPVGSFQVLALLDDQELDSSGSTGTVYWEGLSDLKSPSGETLGRGYLEMTGYVAGIKLS
ncbi:lipocalin-like domain-containing protein [Diaphorobacter caeni]|uniref:lipocalin-like domain-containing protein n=1 Tax=Diaphorobacter caeni TaxID=2784387 RepID=UPI0018908066|nr:carotenoid 1,2-hydratase [Diaphorobacter caeni]MBF5003426.1 carotenoid 1,2-hydratase [Diaphorobacter caeni]